MKISFYKFFVCFFCLMLLFDLNSTVFGQSKSDNKSDTNSSIQEETDEQKRMDVENLLLQGKYQHDGSGVLFHIGTIESVPALLKVLEDNPVKESDGNKFYICTYAHAVNALKKITGQKFIAYEDWKNWWEEYLKNKANQNKNDS